MSKNHKEANESIKEVSINYGRDSLKRVKNNMLPIDHGSIRTIRTMTANKYINRLTSIQVFSFFILFLSVALQALAINTSDWFVLNVNEYIPTSKGGLWNYCYITGTVGFLGQHSQYSCLKYEELPNFAIFVNSRLYDSRILLICSCGFCVILICIELFGLVCICLSSGSRLDSSSGSGLHFSSRSLSSNRKRDNLDSCVATHHNTNRCKKMIYYDKESLTRVPMPTPPLTSINCKQQQKQKVKQISQKKMSKNSKGSIRTMIYDDNNNNKRTMIKLNEQKSNRNPNEHDNDTITNSARFTTSIVVNANNYNNNHNDHSDKNKGVDPSRMVVKPSGYFAFMAIALITLVGSVMDFVLKVSGFALFDSYINNLLSFNTVFLAYRSYSYWCMIVSIGLLLFFWLFKVFSTRYIINVTKQMTIDYNNECINTSSINYMINNRSYSSDDFFSSDESSQSQSHKFAFSNSDLESPSQQKISGKNSLSTFGCLFEAGIKSLQG
jgi:hypothetical protein